MMVRSICVGLPREPVFLVIIVILHLRTIDAYFQVDTPCVIDADCSFQRDHYCDISTELGQVCRQCKNCENYNRRPSPALKRCIKSIVSDCGPCQHGYMDMEDANGFRKNTCLWRNFQPDASAAWSTVIKATTSVQTRFSLLLAIAALVWWWW